MENLNAPESLSPSAGPDSNFIIQVNLKKGKVSFGFDVIGGQEYGTQVTISKIDRRGPADLDGNLQVGDEIHYVNGVKVIGAKGGHVIALVKNAELFGEVNLGICKNFARSEHAVWVTTSNTMPQQSDLASMKPPYPLSEDLNKHHRSPAQRNSGAEEASDGFEEFTARKQNRKGTKGKSVVVFRSGDVALKGSMVLMPNTIELAQIKKSQRGQFKTGVQISSKMTAPEIETKLKMIFPILKHERFYCASYSKKEGSMLLFHGVPSVWDGKSIKKRVQGNSALYILIEVTGTSEIKSQVMQYSMLGAPQMNTATAPAPGEATLQSQNMPEIRPQDLDILDTFLHSESCKDLDVLQELQNCNEMEAMDTSQPMKTEDMPLNTLVPFGDESGWSDPSDSGHGQSDKAEERSQEDIPSVPSGACPPVRPEMREIKSIVDMIVPDSSPLQGGMVFVLIMSESLPPNMDSAVAFFESVPVQVTKHRTTLIGIVPPSDEPGIVTVKVQSRDGIFLGNILFEYVDADKTYLKRLVTDPKLLQKFYMQMAEEQGKKTRESEKQPNLQPPYIVTTAGSSQAFHILATLVFAAAKYDALEPIKIILDSSNGSAVFHAYKDRAKLPESVARDHGNHDIVDYLEEATCRFYEEIKCGKECNQTVDWLELLNAAGEGQTRLNLDAEERETHRLETGRIKDSGYSADVESSTSSSSDPEGSDSERHTSTSSYEDIDYIETGVVDVGNATQHEKNYPADTNTDDTPSSFTLQEVTNLPVIEFKTRFAEDSTVVTSAGKESDIITPSTEEENTVISLAANQSGRSPSPENESGATQTVTKERDITPLVATERNVTPSAERGSDFTPSTGCDSGGNTAVPIAESTSDAKHANSKKNVSLQLAKIESVATPTKLEGVDIPQSAERDSEATPTNSKENTVPPLAEGKSDAMHANSKENTVLQSAKCKRDATPVKSKKPDGPQLAEQESDVASLLKRETGLTPSAAVNNDVMPVAAIVRIITHTASGESNITPSAEDQSDIMPSAEDESNITSSAKDDSDITPSPERERSVISSAAEENNIMSSSHKKTAFILSAPNEVDLEPLAAKARDFKPSNAKGTVESDTFIEVEKHPEEGNKNSERRLSFLSEVEKHPEKETTKLPWRVRFPFEWSKKLLEEMEEQRKKLKERREELKKYEKKREEEMEKHRKYEKKLEEEMEEHRKYEKKLEEEMEERRKKVKEQRQELKKKLKERREELKKCEKRLEEEMEEHRKYIKKLEEEMEERRKKLEEENEEFRRRLALFIEAIKGPIEEKNKRQRRSALCGEVEKHLEEGNKNSEWRLAFLSEYKKELEERMEKRRKYEKELKEEIKEHILQFVFSIEYKKELEERMEKRRKFVKEREEVIEEDRKYEKELEEEIKERIKDFKERREKLKKYKKELEERMEKRRRAIAVKYVEKLKERREELKEADASPMPHSLAIPRGIHELMNKKKNQVVAGEGPFSLKNRVKVYVQGNSLQIDTTAETDASPMRHSLAIPRDIPKKTKGLLGIKTKSEKKLWELKNSQDFEDKESELKRRDPLVGHVKKTCYMPVVDLNFGKLSGQPVEEM